MPIQGLASFPGLNYIVEGSLSFTQGITPSSATLTIAPQANLMPQIGTLIFYDGQSQVQWNNARVDTNSFERNASGLIWRLSIYDRRWKWQSRCGGSALCHGMNLRYDDGTIIEDTKYNPQEMARYCLQAMGESNFDVSALPADDYPEIIWDYSLPSHCLEEICEMYGCRVVLNWDDTVRICNVGTGAQLPITPDILTNSLALTVSDIPDSIVAVGAPDRFQQGVELEAIGIEIDGTHKLLKDLSYLQGLDLAHTDLDFELVIGNPRTRKLAQESVFRYYRVKFPIPSVAGYTDFMGNANAKITNPWQVKFDDTEVQSVREDIGLIVQQTRNLPGIVFGCFCNEDDDDNDNNIAAQDAAPLKTNPWLPQGDDIEIFNNPWHMGHEIQVGHATDHYVVFSKPIYMNSNVDARGNALPGGIARAPAQLVLYTSFVLLDEYTFSPVRSTFYRNTGSNLGTKPRYELFSDIEVWHYWNPDSHSVVDNMDDMRKRAEYYLDGVVQEYQNTTPQTITYAGLKPIDLDGSIQHVHIKIGKSGCTTTASRDNEQIHLVRPYSYRRMMAKVRSGLKEEKKHRSLLRTHKRFKQA